MVCSPVPATLEFQAIGVHQLGRSLTQPDYYYSFRPFRSGCFVVGVFLGDGTDGALFDASGRLKRFSSKDEAQRFCTRFNRAETGRLRRLAAHGLLEGRNVHGS